MTLKQSLKNLAVKNPVFNIIYRVLAGCNFFGRVLVNARFRSEVLTRLKYKERHFQGPTYTLKDRSPVIFTQCEKYLQRVSCPKLLSFGCSTGEEVFTLAEYMPNASIIGVDINEWCIKQCARKNKSEKLHFYHRFAGEFDAEFDFDAIFCIAVFQRGENRSFKDRITEGFTFQQFEDEVAMLHTKLKPGGLLIIHHSDFSFLDTKIADDYAPLSFEENKKRYNRPLFDRNNLRISETNEYYRVFVRQS